MTQILFIVVFMLGCTEVLIIQGPSGISNLEVRSKDILSREMHVFQRESLPTIVVSETCNYSSYCFTCMPGFDGKMDCGMKLSAFCSGTNEVTYQQFKINFEYRYKVKNRDGLIEELRSPPFEETERHETTSTACI